MGHDVADDDRHDRVREQVGQGPAAYVLPTPVVIVPIARITPTPMQKARSARLLSTSPLIELDWTNFTQGLESLKESKAVLPKSTADHADEPGRDRQGVEVGQR